VIHQHIASISTDLPFPFHLLLTSTTLGQEFNEYYWYGENDEGGVTPAECKDFIDAIPNVTAWAHWSNAMQNLEANETEACYWYTGTFDSFNIDHMIDDDDGAANPQSYVYCDLQLGVSTKEWGGFCPGVLPDKWGMSAFLLDEISTLCPAGWRAGEPAEHLSLSVAEEKVADPKECFDRAWEGGFAAWSLDVPDLIGGGSSNDDDDDDDDDDYPVRRTREEQENKRMFTRKSTTCILYHGLTDSFDRENPQHVEGEYGYGFESSSGSGSSGSVAKANSLEEGSIYCTIPVHFCEDNVDFIDALGWNCIDWKHDMASGVVNDCETAIHGYTAEDMAAVRTHCTVTCDACKLCAEDEWQCTKSAQCIRIDWLCDEYEKGPDCDDGTDEEPEYGGTAPAGFCSTNTTSTTTTTPESTTSSTAVVGTSPTGPIDGLTGYFDVTADSTFVEKSGS
jgi:hypothetical protein